MAKKSKNKTVKKPVDKKPTENPATIVKPANAADETPIEEIVAEEMPASDTQASEKPDTAPKEKPADKTPTPKKEEKPANKGSKKENALNIIFFELLINQKRTNGFCDFCGFGANSRFV